jgi:hypothetical protein
VGEPQDRLYVGRVYQLLVQRPPAPAECGNWVTMLEQPGMTRAKEALAIIGTREFTEDQVGYTYRAYLHRAADLREGSSAVRDVLAGMSFDAMRARVLGTDAYYDSHGGTSAGFIAGLYHDVLGKVRAPEVDVACSQQRPTGGQRIPGDRTPSPTELGRWTSVLGTHPSAPTRIQVAGLILTSAEAKDRLVTEWYEWFLRRLPCGSERDHGVSSLVSDRASEQEVMASILAAA